MSPPSIASPSSLGESSTTSTGASENSTTVPNSNSVPWKLYPFESYNDLIKNHGKEGVKVIHMVRHAEGTHNLEENYGDRDNIDARLTPKGLEQCAQLAQQVQANRPELVNNVDDIRVISSPLTRCVQTALHSFPWLAGNDSISFTAYESIRETVNYACDRRRPISVIAQEFPRVDFASFCQQDNDFIWDSYRNRLSDDWEKHMESAELNAVASRGYDGFLFLQQQEQHHLVVCSHSAFLRCILNWGQEGGVPQRMTQILDERSDKTNHKLFDYDDDQEFEQYMRSNYENCELRSFCLLVNKS